MVPLTQAEVSTLQRADSQSGYANVSVLSGRPTLYKQAAALTRGDAARTALLPRSHLVKLGSFSLSRLIASVAVRDLPNPIARLGVYRHEAAVSWQEHRVQLPRRREREITREQSGRGCAPWTGAFTRGLSGHRREGTRT